MHKRKEVKGTVTSNKMNKTVVVTAVRTTLHPRYGKVVRLKKKYYAHAEENLNVGDSVTIVETKPLSKLKRWRVANVNQ